MRCYVHADVAIEHATTGSWCLLARGSCKHGRRLPAPKLAISIRVSDTRNLIFTCKDAWLSLQIHCTTCELTDTCHSAASVLHGIQWVAMLLRCLPVASTTALLWRLLSHGVSQPERFLSFRNSYVSLTSSPLAAGSVPTTPSSERHEQLESPWHRNCLPPHSSNRAYVSLGGQNRERWSVQRSAQGLHDDRRRKSHDKEGAVVRPRSTPTVCPL
jgi:hypothetical protein